MADFASSALDNMETRRRAVGGAIELPLARGRFRLLLKVSTVELHPNVLGPNYHGLASSQRLAG
jgi:hypothetical protein